MKATFVTVIKFLIGWPLSVLAIYYIYRVVSPHTGDIVPRLVEIHIWTLLLGILCFTIFYIIRGYVWHEILRYYSYVFPFRDTLYLWGVSELKRYIPGNIWSFLGRSLLFRERGVSREHLETSFVIEAELFALSGFIVSILALPYGLTIYHISLPPLSISVIIAVVFLLCLLFAGNKLIIGKPHTRFMKLLARVLPPFAFGENIRLISIDALAMLIFGIGNYFVISSIFVLPVTLFWILSAYFTMALLIGYLSIITPTGLGVREGIVILLLKHFVNTSLAGFLSLFSRIILILSEMVFLCGAYMIKRRHISTGKPT